MPQKSKIPYLFKDAMGVKKYMAKKKKKRLPTGLNEANRFEPPTGQLLPGQLSLSWQQVI